MVNWVKKNDPTRLSHYEGYSQISRADVG